LFLGNIGNIGKAYFIIHPAYTCLCVCVCVCTFANEISRRSPRRNGRHVEVTTLYKRARSTPDTVIYVSSNMVEIATLPRPLAGRDRIPGNPLRRITCSRTSHLPSNNASSRGLALCIPRDALCRLGRRGLLSRIFCRRRSERDSCTSIRIEPRAGRTFPPRTRHLSSSRFLIISDRLAPLELLHIHALRDSL